MKAQVKALWKFIQERERVRIVKKAGKAKPWTKDPILQQYRFCNVHREDDTVTKWVRENWRYSGDPDNWFAMSVARWINWPSTLEEIQPAVFKRGLVCYDAQKLTRLLHQRARAGQKVWTGAYMIGTQGNAMDKPKFIAEQVLYPLWHLRKDLRPRKGDRLRTFADRVIAVKNQGRFMVGQMIADAKYSDPHLRCAPDWLTFAVSGPGSRRGLNRVLGRDVDAGWNEKEWFINLMDLREQLELGKDDNFHNQDLQNCLCEFDKYERVRLGEGRPRSKYPGV